MTASVLNTLLPLIALSATSLVLLVLVIIKRNRLASLGIVLLGLGLALVSVAHSTPGSVEPLLVIDGLSQIIMALILVVALFVSLMSYSYFKECGDRLEEYYLLLVLASLGACVMACASQFASLFLGLELLSISLFVLIAYLPERQNGYEASLKYLIPAASSSAFLLLGLAIIYSQNGSLSLAAAVCWAQPPTQPPVDQRCFFGICCDRIQVGGGPFSPLDARCVSRCTCTRDFVYRHRIQRGRVGCGDSAFCTHRSERQPCFAVCAGRSRMPLHHLRQYGGSATKQRQARAGLLIDSAHGLYDDSACGWHFGSDSGRGVLSDRL